MSVITGPKPGKKETTLELFNKAEESTRSIITNQALGKRSESRNQQEPINMQRRILMGGALAAAVLSSSGRVLAEENHGGPDNPFILLLNGIYRPVPVGDGPAKNLGLTTVNLNDGNYSKTRIYPIFGILESYDQDRPIGTFYPEATLANGQVTFNPPANPGFLCAYDLPGGAIAMQFLPPPAGAPAGFNGFVPFPDGRGGYYLEGTFELTILEATGVYRDFQGGHNHMVDRLHQLSDGSFDEFCFCNISQYQFP
jgi:hypothetical protein